MFVLGLRHGFDPDHIAMIDGMAYNSLQNSEKNGTKSPPSSARWIGTLFALGHGLTVTLIAVILGLVSRTVHLPASIGGVLKWLPIALLLLVGTMNLRALLKRQQFRLAGWKTHFLPHRLRDSSHPLAIFLVGGVFALMFDTATQVAAWSYAADGHSGVSMALMVGLMFTAGMVVTDTLDGRLMMRMLGQVSRRAEAQAYRRKVGWMVVVLSYGIALYGIAKIFYPAFEFGDTIVTVIGMALFFGLFGAYVLLTRRPASPKTVVQK